MKVCAIIQARLGSTRFPGKVLAALCGKPLLAHVIERALAIQGVDEVAVAAPLLGGTEVNERLRPVCWAAGIGFYRAEWERDVTARLDRVAEAMRADVVVRLTGDNPLIAPEVCQQVLRLWWVEMATRKRGQSVYAHNLEPSSGYPWGLDCQVFDRDLLNLANRAVTDQNDREHVCLWMARQPEERVHQAIAVNDGPTAYGPVVGFATLKLSVDTPHDLAVVESVMARLPAGPTGFSALATALAAKAAGLLGPSDVPA